MEIYMHLEHPFPPVFDQNSRILILGSFPSVKSREQGFFYGHPQNRFWRVTAAVMACPVPETIEEKHAFLLSNGIALWDVIAACEIENSADSSIRNAVRTIFPGFLPQRISMLFLPTERRQTVCIENT